MRGCFEEQTGMDSVEAMGAGLAGLCSERRRVLEVSAARW